MTFFSIDTFQCFAQEDMRVFYQWMRLEQMDQWLHWFVLACCLIGLVSYVIYWYRKDWVELPRSIGWTLLTLRLLAMLGILIFFFDLQKRTEQRVTRSSRLAVLVDTSLSMSMPQQDEVSVVASSPGSRISAVQQSFSQSQLLKQLQQKHDVNVFRFDQSARPSAVASFAKPKESNTAGETDEARVTLWRWLSRFALAGTVLSLLGALLMASSLIARVYGDLRPLWPFVLVASVVAVISGFVMMSTAILRADQIPWKSLWSFLPPESAIGPSRKDRKSVV